MADRQKGKAKKTPIPKSRALLLFQAATLAGSIWLLCAVWTLRKESDSPIRVIGGALLYLLLAWACSFGLTLWTYMATSLDRFADLVSAALGSSVHGCGLYRPMFFCFVTSLPRCAS